MKRVIFCVLLCLLLICGSALADTSIQPEAGDFPKDQAVRIATEQFLNASGVDEKGLQDYTVIADLYASYAMAGGETMPRRWQIVFTLTENPEIWYTVLIASPSGALFAAAPDDFSSRLSEFRKDAEARATAMEQGEAWIKEKGPWLFWSYQDKAAFVLAYGRSPSGDPDAQTGLPGEGDIRLDQAISITQAAVTARFPAAQEQWYGLRLNVSFLPEWRSTAEGTTGAWILGFYHPQANANGEYALLYQAIVLSPGGTIEEIYKQEYRDGFDKEPIVTSWTPEGQGIQAPAETTGIVYYNSRGGKYYHTDAQCPSVSSEYFPLKAINKAQLTGGPFQNLLPCPYCVK